MQVAFHFGMHCTDEDSLARCLLKNRDALLGEGIVVPGPGRYRPLIRKALEQLQGAAADPETEREMLAQITDQDHARRVVLSSESFLCPPQGAIGQGMLYPVAGDKSPWFRRLFPNARCEFFFALRNVATLLPMLLARPNAPAYGQLVSETDPLQLSWADMVRRVQAANPGVALTVWCDEDTPFIWPEVLRAVSGHSDAVRLDHVNDRLSGLMSRDGMARMLAHFEQQPPRTEAQRRETVAAFLETSALDEALELEIDLPGWGAGHVAALNERYEADIDAIAAMPDLHFIRP